MDGIVDFSFDKGGGALGQERGQSGTEAQETLADSKHQLAHFVSDNGHLHQLPLLLPEFELGDVRLDLGVPGLFIK